MKIAGMMALNRFPYWRKSVMAMAELCDKVFFRFDCQRGDPEILRDIKNVVGEEKFGGCLMATDAWSVPQWREDCLRFLDDYKPDMVVFPDEDEILGDSPGDMKAEMNAFMASDKLGMMMEFAPLVSNDGRVIRGGKPYAESPHMKVFKWRVGLSYYPYHGFGTIAQYFKPECQWKAKSKIMHYCAFTPDMEKAKTNWRENKSVTLLGFGPTSEGRLNIKGEVWSCNNCYEGMHPDAFALCTRIFEMHNLDKRDRIRAKDGRLHFAHLNDSALAGRRIIVQEPTDRIKNSESFPIDDLVDKLGVDWFMGTPCYMLAMAIYEGYNQITIYGIDQMDWEHTLQRECFGFWVGYALGMGIHVGGRLTFLERHEGRRYGYDWGPELDDVAQEMIWHGHPIQVKYKNESQPVRGDMHDFSDKKGWPFSGKPGSMT